MGEAREGKVAISRPLRGTKRELVELACKNAASVLRERDEKAASARAVLEELRQRLHLTRLPRRIECYDISTIQGRHSVGSGVVFTEAMPDKANYRRYRIRQVQGQDDFAMLAEVFSRRFRPEKVQAEGVPDLVVVDGGNRPAQRGAVDHPGTGVGGAFRSGIPCQKPHPAGCGISLDRKER